MDVVMSSWSIIVDVFFSQSRDTLCGTPKAVKKQISPNGKQKKIIDARRVEFHMGLGGPFLKK